MNTKCSIITITTLMLLYEYIHQTEAVMSKSWTYPLEMKRNSMTTDSCEEKKKG